MILRNMQHATCNMQQATGNRLAYLANWHVVLVSVRCCGSLLGALLILSAVRKSSAPVGVWVFIADVIGEEHAGVYRHLGLLLLVVFEIVAGAILVTHASPRTGYSLLAVLSTLFLFARAAYGGAQCGCGLPVQVSSFQHSLLLAAMIFTAVFGLSIEFFSPRETSHEAIRP